MQADATPPSLRSPNGSSADKNTTATSFFLTNTTNPENSSNSNKTVNAIGNTNSSTTSQANSSNNDFSSKSMSIAPVAPPPQETEPISRFKPEDLLELQERITKEILNSKLQEKEMIELQVGWQGDEMVRCLIKDKLLQFGFS